MCNGWQRKGLALLASILVLVGTSGCMVDDETHYYNSVYFPNVVFWIEGNVQDHEKNPLEGIRIITKWCFDDIDPVTADTTYTNKAGDYISTDVAYTDSMRVVVEDPAGVYTSDSIDLHLEYMQRALNSVIVEIYGSTLNLVLEEK